MRRKDTERHLLLLPCYAERTMQTVRRSEYRTEDTRRPTSDSSRFTQTWPIHEASREKNGLNGANSCVAARSFSSDSRATPGHLIKLRLTLIVASTLNARVGKSAVAYRE
jgi:hypothetical protein